MMNNANTEFTGFNIRVCHQVLIGQVNVDF